MKSRPLQFGESQSYRMFMPQFAKVTDVRLKADTRLRSVKLYDGSRRDLMKVTTTQTGMPIGPIRSWVDDKGLTLMTEMDMLGLKVTTWEVGRDVALEAIAGQELDLAVDTLVQLGKPLRLGHRSSKVTYRVTIPGVKAAEAIPDGATQSLMEIDEN